MDKAKSDMAASNLIQIPPEILAAYGFNQALITPITHGNINQTFAVQQGEVRFALQQLNPIFHPEIHRVIECVTHDLQAANVLTPTLVPLADGKKWLLDQQGRVWRCMTWILGKPLAKEKVGTHHCYQAGLLLGRFHAALQHTHLPELKHPRLGVHDTLRYMEGLQHAVQTHVDHAAWSQVRQLAQNIGQMWQDLPPLPEHPLHLVHGDPKLDNIVFDQQDQALALIDLDTVAMMPLSQELGDAWRSWCNPGGEQGKVGLFDERLFEASLRGYCHSGAHLLATTPIEALTAAVPTIALELSARFAKDALEERYFGWDKQTYDFPWQHHLVRATNQLELAQSYLRQQGAMARLLQQVVPAWAQV